MWYHEHEDGVVLQVKVTPHARQNRVIGVYGDFLKVAIAAVPEGGRANEALIQFLAFVLEVSSGAMVIAKGAHQPLKIIFVPISSRQLAEALRQYNIVL
jgi:uncharacterized protein (TIGR00251 family)